MIAINLRKQQALDADLKAMHKINFARNLDQPDFSNYAKDTTPYNCINTFLKAISDLETTKRKPLLFVLP